MSEEHKEPEDIVGNIIKLRNIEIQKLKTQPFDKTNCCKRICCLPARELTRQYLTKSYIFKFTEDEINQIIELIKQLEKRIFEVTKMTPKISPLFISAIATFIWGSQTKHPLSKTDICLDIFQCTMSSLTKHIDNLYRLKIIQNDDSTKETRHLEDYTITITKKI